MKFSYIIPLIIAAFCISMIGALFSITGLSKLFAGAATSVMFMAAALEFAKIISAGFVHRFWDELNLMLKSYLVLAVATLMLITSAGIFGYLSHAYQNSAVALNNLDIKIQALNNEQLTINGEVTRIQKNIDEIPDSRVSKKLETKNTYEPEIQRLKKRIFEINAEISFSMVEKAGYQAKIGPLAYLSESMKIPMDVIAKWFIFVFVLVFDPLAIVLVISVSWLIKREEKLKKSKATEEVIDKAA